MYIILGGTGNVGSAVVKELLANNDKVLAITHSQDKVKEIEALGAEAAVADVKETNALRDIFSRGKRLFLLNPPASFSTDTVKEERAKVKSILDAIPGSGLEKIVAESTFGAQAGDAIGDLGVLYEMEQALERQEIPFTIQRGAYYYSNWGFSLETAQKEGKVFSYFPEDFKLPMVAPEDLGSYAAKLLMQPVNDTGLYHTTGPEDYSPNDVAAAFAKALGKPVEAVRIPESQWEDSMKKIGFSDAAAKSMANMTRLTIEQKNEFPKNPVRGIITLEQYIKDLVGKSKK